MVVVVNVPKLIVAIIGSTVGLIAFGLIIWLSVYLVERCKLTRHDTRGNVAVINDRQIKPNQDADDVEISTIKNTYE